MGLVGGRDGEDEQQGEGGARDEGEEVGVGEGVDVVDGEGGREAELVEEGGQELGVGFEGDEGWCRGGGVGWGGFGGGHFWVCLRRRVWFVFEVFGVELCGNGGC